MSTDSDRDNERSAQDRANRAQRWWTFPRVRRHPRAPEPDKNPAASMALLQEVLDRPLDPGYESAADTRREKGLAPSTSARSPLLVVFAILMGFLATVAVLQLRTPDPAAAGNRAALIDRVDAASEHGDHLALQIEDLRSEVTDLEDRALQEAEANTDANGEQLRSSSVAAGAVAMQGPGVRIVMDDAAEDFSEDGGTAENRVLAHDLQVVVNGLWLADAESIAINGQRLTSIASIRYAGEAIVVDFRGLTRPYVIEAIGDPDALNAELTDGATGEYATTLQETYGLSFEATDETSLEVPAATRASTRVAQVIPPPDPLNERDTTQTTEPEDAS